MPLVRRTWDGKRQGAGRPRRGARPSPAAQARPAPPGTIRSTCLARGRRVGRLLRLDRGFVNSGRSLVRILIVTDEAAPNGLHIHTSFPNHLGTPAF
jgi:hypothetical protein